MVEHRAFSRSSGFFLASNSGSRSSASLDPLGSLAGGPLAGRLSPAVAGRGVLLQLSPQRLDLGLGLGQRLLQGRATAERGGAGTGPHPHPVLRHPLEVDQPLGHQGRHALGQQSVQQLDMIGAEIGQGVVVDRDVAEEPAIGVVGTAQLGELAGAADAVDGGVGPQRHEDLGIDAGPPGIAGDGLDRLVQGAEVQPHDELPDDPGGVIGRDQVVEGGGAEDDLLPVGGAEPRATGRERRLGGSRRCVVIGRHREERGLFGPGRIAIAWCVHADILAPRS